jgi:acyl-CoA thioesterase-1
MHMHTATVSTVLVFCLAVLPGCRGSADEREASTAAGGPSATSAAATPAPARPPVAARPRVVALGDSLTAGLGLPETEAFPALLQQKMEQGGYAFDVVNAGVSGDTSAGGLRRLDWALEGDVRVLILALGANDGLRGLPVNQMKENLGRVIEQAKARRITVILAGMEAPPNYGPEYTSGFRNVYRELAREHDVILVPFLLDRVAGISALNQGDGIHPNRQGAAIIAETIWSALRPVLDKVSTSS